MVITNVIGSTSMNKKMSKGRQKIQMKKIEETNSLHVTFSKRRTGLFKKASEICVLTGAQIGIVLNSPGGRVFAYGDPNPDVLFDRYDNNNNKEYATTNKSTEATQNCTLPLPMKDFNQHYVEVSMESEAEMKRRETITVSSGELDWCNVPVDGMDVEELQHYLCSLEEVVKTVWTTADELTMKNKSSAFFGSNVHKMESNNSILPVDIPTNAAVGGGFNFQYGGDFGNL